MIPNAGKVRVSQEEVNGSDESKRDRPIHADDDRSGATPREVN
ncbi:hypothetical protein Stsp02_34020 [Streptomyces sp. NBRC 14336]|nr:hypothetical protein Stsp02_34020 [Streptomyces sp. NBRC 14336]